MPGIGCTRWGGKPPVIPHKPGDMWKGEMGYPSGPQCAVEKKRKFNYLVNISIRYSH